MKAKQSRQSLVLRLGALLLTAALIATLAACNSDDDKGDKTTTASATGSTTGTTLSTMPVSAAEIPAWRIEIRGVPNITSFSSVDAQYLPKVEVEMTTMNNGFNVTNRYGGVTLRSILNLFYVQDVISVDAISMDGRTVSLPQALAMAPDTVLAWEIDGVAIDTPSPLRICPKSGAAELYLDSISALTIAPFVPGAVTTMPTTGPIVGPDNLPIPSQPITTWSTYPTSIWVPPTPVPTDPTTTTTTTTTRTTRPPFNIGSYTGPPTTTRTTTTTTVTTTTTPASTTHNVFG